MKSNLIETINSFSELEQGWNGYGADPIPICVIQTALKIAAGLSEAEVYPTGRQSIQFEFGDDVELEIFDNKLDVLFCRNEREYLHTFSLSSLSIAVEYFNKKVEKLQFNEG